MLIRKLVECVSKGEQPAAQCRAGRQRHASHSVWRFLRYIGTWMGEERGQRYIGCGRAEGLPKPDFGRYTRKGQHLYYALYEKTRSAPCPCPTFGRQKSSRPPAGRWPGSPVSHIWMSGRLPPGLVF